MPEFTFSVHALEQMQRRGIEELILQAALENPLEIINEDGLTVYHYLFQENGSNYLLRVFINLDKHPFLIVTVYKTSKIKKYLP